MPYRSNTLTAQQIRKLFFYDPTEGHLVWREARYSGSHKKRVNVEAWTIAGYPHKNRAMGTAHTRIKIDGIMYFASYLVWVYMTGEQPPANKDIEHKDCDGLNNRWKNLRLATPAQNMWNRKTPRTNKTGHKGVYYNLNKDNDLFPYRVSLRVNGKLHKLGVFPYFEEAVEAYCKAAERLRGEFTHPTDRLKHQDWHKY